MRINHQPVVGGPFVYERHLHIRRLLTGIHLAGRNQMVDEQFSFYIRRHHAQFVHPLFRRTFHVALIAHPGRTPSRKVDAKRERSTHLPVFQELKGNFFIHGFFIIHPHDKSRQISILSGRIFRFKLQVPLQGKHCPRFIRPPERMCPILVMLLTERQGRLRSGKFLRHSLLKRK